MEATRKMQVLHGTNKLDHWVRFMEIGRTGARRIVGARGLAGDTSGSARPCNRIGKDRDDGPAGGGSVEAMAGRRVPARERMQESGASYTSG